MDLASTSFGLLAIACAIAAFGAWRSREPRADVAILAGSSAACGLGLLATLAA
jgi:hypothetical protein